MLILRIVIINLRLYTIKLKCYIQAQYHGKEDIN